MPGQMSISGSGVRHLWPVGLVVLALAVLSPTRALAQTNLEVRAYCLSISALYDALDYESALAQVARARAVAKTPADNATLSLYEGVILADMNRREKSEAAFRKALTVQPDARLPVKVSPKVAQRFEQLREAVKQEQLPARSKPSPAPKTATPPPPPPKKADAPVQESKPPTVVSQTELPAANPSASPISGSLSQESSGVSKQGFTRPQVLIPAVAGGVLVMLGGTSWALSRSELSSLNNDDPKLATAEDAHSAASRGHTYQAVGLGLLGAGVASLGFALGWNVFGPPSSGEPAVSVGTDGSSAFVQGRLP